MRGKKEFDIDRDPPPDLAIEVEISRSALDRMGIYATLGVLEVWRFDGEELTVHQLRRDGRYLQSRSSRALPFLPLGEIVRFLRASDVQDESSLGRSFRKWVRDELAPEREQREKEKQEKPKGGKKKPR
jgi:hypothetical protein